MSGAEQFLQWYQSWTRLASFTSAILPDEDERIERIVSLWREPVPGHWRRSADDFKKWQKSPEHRRYRRTDNDQSRTPEHWVEYEILVPCFAQTRCFEMRLADGLAAYPLVRDSKGKRQGDVEADILLLTESAGSVQFVLCEVKAGANGANDPWYAAVESLRQFRLFQEDRIRAREMLLKLGNVDLPENISAIAAVVARPDYYKSRGKRKNGLMAARKLAYRCAEDLNTQLRICVWDRDSALIEELRDEEIKPVSAGPPPR